MFIGKRMFQFQESKLLNEIAGLPDILKDRDLYNGKKFVNVPDAATPREAVIFKTTGVCKGIGASARKRGWRRTISSLTDAEKQRSNQRSACNGCGGMASSRCKLKVIYHHLRRISGMTKKSPLILNSVYTSDMV